jgi:hypothetical protein
MSNLSPQPQRIAADFINDSIWTTSGYTASRVAFWPRSAWVKETEREHLWICQRGGLTRPFAPADQDRTKVKIRLEIEKHSDTD